MNRLLLFSLLLSIHAYGADLSPSVCDRPDTFFSPANDTLPPTITCPANDTVVALPGDCEAMYNYTVTVDDDQPNPILIQLSGLASGSFFQIGNTTNVFLVTDQVGNTATCAFTVTVEHFQTTPICKSLVDIPLGPNCTVQVNAAQILNLPIGCADVYNVAVDKTPPLDNGPWVPANLTQADLDKFYGVRVTDPLSGELCIGEIHVIDTIPPALVCEDLNIPCVILNTTPDFLHDSLNIAAALPMSPDACGGLVMLDFVDTYLTEDCTSGYSETISRLWTASDERDNETTCIQQIHLTLLNPDDIQVPADTTLDCVNPDLSLDNTGVPYFTFAGRTFTNLCSIDVGFNDSLEVICPGSTHFFRKWVFTNICVDTSATKTQVIDILDTKGPSVACDSSLFVLVPGANCTGMVDLPPITLSDDCSPVVWAAAIWSADGMSDTLVGTLENGGTGASFTPMTEIPVYSTVLTYAAMDSCGNVGTCEMWLTVADSSAPLAGCFPIITAQLSPNGSYALGADTLDFNSDVACGQQLYYKVRRKTSNPVCLSSDQFDDAVVFCCADAGDTIDVILRVYDVAVPDGPVSEDYAISQSSDCSLKVVVVDTMPAQCTAPPDVTVSCGDFDPSLNSYGVMVQSCNVDSVAVVIDDTQFDSACAKGIIVRTFEVYDKHGDGSQCSQQIEVEFQQDFYVHFPDDTIVKACNGNGLYGEPQFLNNGCGQIAAVFSDTTIDVVPDACQRIERKWLVYNLCTYAPNQAVTVVPNPAPEADPMALANLPGPIVSAPGAPAPWAATQSPVDTSSTGDTDFSTFWDANINAYEYTQIIWIIDDQAPVVSCPDSLVAFGDTTVNDPAFWNQAYWTDAATGLNDMCEGAAALSVIATDSCAGAELQVSYLLFLDLDGDDTQETVINSNNAPAPGTVNFNNAGNPNYSGGTSSIFDGRAVAADDLYRWAVHLTPGGGQLTAEVQWKTLAQMPAPGSPYGEPGIAPLLPYGTHRIQWVVSDECGNQTTCEYIFSVADTGDPEVNCLTGLMFDLPVSQSLELGVTDVLLNAQDNCTPPTPFTVDLNLLEYSLRKTGAGSGFPVDTGGQAVGSLGYNCDDLGTQTGELWVRDLAGNTSFCTFELELEDPGDFCSPVDSLSIGGNIRTEVDTAVVNAIVTISPTQPDIDSQTVTDAQGVFLFPSLVVSGSDYTLTPYKNDDPLNGVSTFDLVLISRHILGLEQLNSPYKIIAADANKSGSVTSFDVVEFRKLILGIYNELPNNTSWRFVDRDFVFPQPANPFASQFPEFITRTGVTEDQADDNFVGVKIGDVNNTVLPDNVQAPLSRSSGIFFFQLNDRGVERDEVFSVRFKSAEKALGYQFTLNTSGLEVVEIVPGIGLGNDHFAVFPQTADSDGAVTVSVETGAAEFSIIFRATQAGRLSNMLGVSSRITRAEAYLPAETPAKAETPYSLKDIALLFDNRLISKVGFELYQNQPNPFREETTIGFHLPSGSEATLTVFNDAGHVIHSQSGYYQQGYHSIRLDRNQIDASGVLYYKLETATESAVRKMLLIP
ncbi:MAG: HYR domain-containing protein [Lewinellaceae bacterium]|nr:HYR domain-containing protein [Lewinellaceae bacterium]